MLLLLVIPTMRGAQRTNLLLVSTTANIEFFVASLLRMTKITLRVRFQTILAAYLQTGHRRKAAERTAEGGCPHY
jgi:hypothetical protein